MRVLAGDDVAVAVAVDVEHQQLRAARLTELDRVVLPLRVAGQAGWLLPPAVLPQHVGSAVAVDIADAEPMREAGADARGRQRVPLPALLRVLPVDGRVAEAILELADQFGSAVAVQVREGRRFVVDAVEHDVGGPAPLFAARVLVPRRLLAREADHQHVVPAVGIEVVHEGEEVVRVVGCRERRWRIQLARARELGTRIPERAGDDVHVAVAVEVAVGSPFAQELVTQLLLVERAHLLGARRRCEARDGNQQENEREGAGLHRGTQVPRAAARNARRSTASSICLCTGLPAPWPAAGSTRSRIGALPPCACCSVAANL